MSVGLTLLLATHVQAQYTEVDSYLNPNRIISLGSTGYATNLADDTAAFQRAIDDVAAAGGGRVIVPRGTYELAPVTIKSEVHLIFDGQSKIRAHAPALDPTRNVNLFNIGQGSFAENVSVRGVNSWSRFDLNKSDHDRLRAFGVGDAKNFLISNFNFVDSRTTFSGLNIGWDGDNPDGSARIPDGGTIEHLRSSNAHYGYGAIQVQAGHNLEFRDIESVGGVALRLETGYKLMNLAQSASLDNINAENINSHHGQTALMLSPHAMHNGSVTANGISSIGSEYAVLIDDGSLHKFTEQEIIDNNLTLGDFESIAIDDVHATFSYGPIETRFAHLQHYPEALHGDIFKLAEAYGKLYRGPSIAPVSNLLPDDPTVSVTNITSAGFEYHPGQISEADHTPLGDRNQIATDGIPPAGRLLGDITDDELWTSEDIDLLFDAVESGSTLPMFDIANRDGLADMDDVSYWLRGIMGSEFGDADLDGRVSFLDIEIVAENFNQAGFWGEGDFNNDGWVNQLDLDIIESFYSPHMADEQLTFDEAVGRFSFAVPEPGTGGILFGLAMLAFVSRRRQA